MHDIDGLSPVIACNILSKMNSFRSDVAFVGKGDWWALLLSMPEGSPSLATSTSSVDFMLPPPPPALDHLFLLNRDVG